MDEPLSFLEAALYVGVIAVFLASVFGWFAKRQLTRELNQIFAFTFKSLPCDLEYQKVYNILCQIASRAGIPSPGLMIVADDDWSQAQVLSSKKRSGIIVTRQLLFTFTEKEFAGIMAHEIGHLLIRERTRFILLNFATTFRFLLFYTSTLFFVFTFFGDSQILAAQMFCMYSTFVSGFLYLIFELAGCAVARRGEIKADLEAVRLTSLPIVLSGMRKLQITKEERPQRRTFLRRLMELFRTHPPLEERIRRLEVLANQESTQF